MHRVQDLLIWQKAYALTLDVYRATDRFPSDERLALTTQTRFTASTLPAYVLEYYRQPRAASTLNALSDAADSLQKLSYYLELAHDLGYLIKEHLELLLEQIEGVLILLAESQATLKPELGYAKTAAV